MEEKKPHYKRILVKLSGEALSNGDRGILNYDFLEEIGYTIKKCVEMGTQVDGSEISPVQVVVHLLT